MIVTNLVKQRTEAGQKKKKNHLALTCSLLASFIRGTGRTLLSHSFSGRRVGPTMKLTSVHLNSCCPSLLALAHSSLRNHMWFKQQTEVTCPGLFMEHFNAGISFPYTAPKGFLDSSEVDKRNWLNSLLYKLTVCVVH